MENLIQKHRAFVASQIEKSFNSNIQFDEVDIEKAHKDGDMHPNGKWVWVQAANGGKGDWRVAGARTHKKASAGAIPSSDVKPVTAKEFSKNKNAVVEMLKNCDSKTDSNGDKRYHCEFYALGKDRGSAWFKKSDIEAYLRSYDDAKITPIKSDNASKEQKFKQSFKDASDEVLQKVVDGKIQASDEERKWAKDLINERRAAGVRGDAAKKIIDLLKVSSSKYSDIKKVKAFKTDKGNYYIDYDGADTGIVLNGNRINDKDFENAGVEVVKTRDDSATKQKSDPRDKVAQDAGFKDYAEMKGWQDYNTAKSLLKKKSTKDSLRKQLEADVAKYEKEHSDVIKRVAEKKDNVASKDTKSGDKKNDNSNVKSKQSNSGYSDLTFDEAVKIGESHISDEKKSSIEKEPLRYLQEDAKNHRWEDDVKYQEGELKEAVNMKIGSSNFMAPNKVVTPEYKSKEIKRCADALATAKEEEKLYKKALAKAKAEKKQFLDNTGYDLTEDEVIKYINKFRPKDEPNAVVDNRWHTLAGRIGSTSATIRVGSGKAKDINDGMPDWRPIGVYSYSTMGWDGKMMTITGTVQSWKEVKNCLSDTENMSISIYKHPKQ